MRRYRLITTLVLSVLSFSVLLSADTTQLTILHTNDLHSHMLGFSPNIDYSPETTNDDLTLGGWARIATLIKKEKSERTNPVLVLDAGDFLMGSLFHMVSREEGIELLMLKEMGYDMTTLGNHEFDLKPEGLARIIKSAEQKGKLPGIVASNVIFDSTDKRDDELEALFNKGLVKPYDVLIKDGIKIGLFGLVGEDAAGVAPFAKPVTFANQVETATRMVNVLREKEAVDVVICLSHGGLEEYESIESEDVFLAEAVPGIDIIISGHSHTKLDDPIIHNNTIIVQSWGYGKRVGVLNVNVSPEGVKLADYESVVIDDSIESDEAIVSLIDSSIQLVNEQVLAQYGLSFDQVLVETDFDLKLEVDESNLGNLITDAIRWAVDRVEYDPADPQSRTSISIQSNGVIRDDILKGKTGMVSASDLFRTVPLGIGWDGSMSYPLVSVYITAPEIKKACEILTTVYKMKNDDYYMQFSGANISFNFNRMFFDRITSISLEDENGDYQPLNYRKDDGQLYKVVTNVYNATFLKVIGSFTKNILTIIPKDKDGNPIEDFIEHRVDGDPEQDGIQEIKDWTALMDYVQSFEDKDGDGIPEIPERYRGKQDRQIQETSKNPIKLLAGGNYLTWSVFGVVLTAAGLLTGIVYLLI